MSERKDLEHLKKIKAIGIVNEEIIQRIKNKQKMVTSYHYKVIQGSFKFEVKETKDEIDVSAFLSVWKPNVKMGVIPDLFKDKINFNCSNFDDVVRLNGEMPLVAEHYKMFGGSAEAIEVIEKFKANLELLQVCLGSLEEKLMDATSRMEELTEETNKLNKQVEALINNAKVTPIENDWGSEYQQIKQKKEEERKKEIENRPKIHGFQISRCCFNHAREPTASDYCNGRCLHCYGNVCKCFESTGGQWKCCNQTGINAPGCIEGKKNK